MSEIPRENQPTTQAAPSKVASPGAGDVLEDPIARLERRVGRLEQVLHLRRARHGVLMQICIHLICIHFPLAFVAAYAIERMKTFLGA